MSITGDLAHLPIVDVIQLIYSTKKSGTLTVQSRKGESQLVFNDGYFVSANHLNNSVRIGQILIEKKKITQEYLEEALLEQRNAGAARKPLIATLIEQGVINPEDAYLGLEALIEMTIVEILTWTNGTFSLDVTKSDINDEYRYFPDTLKREILMNAQAVLMDALRIYDEMMRDGTLEEQFFPTEAAERFLPPRSGDISQQVTADLLGLDNLDSLSKKIPQVFTGLSDNSSVTEHRRVIADVMGELPLAAQEQICSLLQRFSLQAPAREVQPGFRTQSLAVIVFSQDTFIKHAITTICRSKNHIVFTTDDDSSLDLIIAQSFSQDLLPVLIVDDPAFIGDGYTHEGLTVLLRQKRSQFPRISIIQLSVSPEDMAYPPHIMDEGTDARYPRPVLHDNTEAFITQMSRFFEAFCSALDKSLIQADRRLLRRLKDNVTVLCTLREPPEVARELLRCISAFFERSLILVTGSTEMTAEKGIGITAAKSAGMTGPLMFKIPRGQDSIIDKVIEERRIFFGHCSDSVLNTHLFSAMPAPHDLKIFLAPLIFSGKVIAMIYADFGTSSPDQVPREHLDILFRIANLVLENTLHRKKLERLTRQP